MRDDIRHRLETDDVINATLHPELDRALNSYRFRGDLTTVLPQIYATRARAQDFDVRFAAVRASTRPYILTGRAAAKTVWWPELMCDEIDLAHPSMLFDRAGFRFHERYITPSLVSVVDGVPVTRPELTVLDLIPELGPDVVDEALRRRVVTLPRLHAALALTPRRRGNRLRREVLRDSRDAPWSALERRAHRILREAKIGGWTTNYEVTIGGLTYYLDLAWPARKLAVEIDGFEFHGDRDAFHRDRLRDAALTTAGWHVLHFSAESLLSLPDAVRTALRGRRAA